MAFKMILLSFHSALVIFLQGGLASARTSATSCWSSSPSCGSTATSPTTSSAATTPKRPKIFPLQSRLPRSLPCSTRRLAWWSLRARGSTSSRRPNSASTCRIKHTRSGAGQGCHQAKPAGGAAFGFYLLFWRIWTIIGSIEAKTPGTESRNWTNGLLLPPDAEFPLCHSLLIFIHSLDGHFGGDGGVLSLLDEVLVCGRVSGQDIELGSVWIISDANLDFWWGPVERASVLDPSNLIPPWKLSWKNVFYFSVSQVCLTNATVSRPDGRLRVISENK